MSQSVTRRLLVATVAAACAHFATPWHAVGQQLQPAEIIESIGIDQRLGARIPGSLVFRDEAGATIRLDDVLGEKPVVLVPMYYECPMLCGVTVEGLIGALKTLDDSVGEGFDVITVSIDPQETPAMAAASEDEAIARYGRSPDVTATGWHALVGDADTVRRLTEAIGFRYLYDEQRDEYAHVSGVMVVTPEGVLARYLYGVAYSGRDLQLALVEASEGRLGSLADQVMLLCYHYDPIKGRYGFAVWSAIRILGLLTVALMAVGIGLMLRRERAGGSTRQAEVTHA